MQTDVAELAGIIVETGLYGVFTVLTVGALYVLLKRRRGGPATLNHPLIATSIVMYMLATAQIVVDCIVIFDAFIDLPRPARKVQMANITIPIVATKRALFFAMMILGDTIVIYRCWIVWGRNWLLIILPSCCSIVSAVLAYMTIWATQHREAGSFILKEPWTYGTVIFVMSLCANAIATSLIAYRIWRNEAQLSGPGTTSSGRSVTVSGRGRLLPIARILIESGSLNTVFLITYIVVLQVQKGQGSLPIVADMSTPLVGIIFSLVIVRVGLNRTTDTTRLPSTSERSNTYGNVPVPINMSNRHELSTFQATVSENDMGMADDQAFDGRKEYPV